ncbi:hypothetical protein PGB90_009966 [Kerria lacca]
MIPCPKALVALALVPLGEGCCFPFYGKTVLHDVMQVLQNYFTMISRPEHDYSKTNGTPL